MNYGVLTKCARFWTNENRPVWHGVGTIIRWEDRPGQRVMMTAPDGAKLSCFIVPFELSVRVLSPLEALARSEMLDDPA